MGSFINPNLKVKIRLRRPCKRCEQMFMPDGGCCSFCEKCKKPKGNRTNHTIKKDQWYISRVASRIGELR